MSEVFRIEQIRREKLEKKADDDAVRADVEKLSKYGELQTIDALAGGDVLKYNEVLKLTIGTVINKLAYDKEKAEYQERLMKVKRKNAERDSRNNRRGRK